MRRVARPWLIKGLKSGSITTIAEVAQLVEHIPEEDGVAGSSPALGTKKCENMPRRACFRLWLNRLLYVPGWGIMGDFDSYISLWHNSTWSQSSKHQPAREGIHYASTSIPTHSSLLDQYRWFLRKRLSAGNWHYRIRISYNLSSSGYYRSGRRHLYYR